MRKLTLYAFVIIMLFNICGCQSTPEKPVVVNKGDNKLQEIIRSTPLPTGQGTNINQGIKALNGSQWTEKYSITNLDCDINAQISVPNTDAFPVYKVAKQKFDSATADKLIKYFTSTATGVRKTSDTKEELEEQLVIAKKGTYAEDDNGGRWEPYDGQKEDIEKFEDQIKNAQPEVFNTITNDSITLPVDNTYAMPDGSRVYIDASENYFSLKTDKFGIMQLESWIIGGDAIPGEPSGTTIGNVKISEEEAIDKAVTTISDLEIKDIGIAETEKARIVNNYTYNITNEGWCITLTRKDGNSIPINISSNQLYGLLDYKTEDYVERWSPERITIFIDDTGLCTLYWQNALQINNVMNINVPLLSFDDIKERIKKNIEFGYSQTVKNGQANDQSKISVYKIVLTNVLVPIKNDLEHQMLQPAWLTYYKNPQYKNMTFVFAVNAIDGSSIDLVKRKKVS